MTHTMTLTIPQVMPPVAAAPSGQKSFFQPIDTAQTEVVFQDYMRFIDGRNGTADFERFTFSKREEHMAALGSATTRFTGDFDEALFRRQYDAYDGSIRTPWTTRLLLLLCKVNAAEAYAVDVMRAAIERQGERPEAQYVAEKVAITEEQYHSRLLVGCAQYFGIEVTEAPKVRPILRLMIHGLANLPGRTFHSLILASEGFGLYVLHGLLEATRKILKDHPEVREAVEERIFNVMIDEVGHVTFNRYAAGPLGVRAARKLYPYLQSGLSIGPEYRDVCGYVENLIPLAEFDFGHLPEEVRRRAFFV
jgi:hypothetical protein